MEGKEVVKKPIKKYGFKVIVICFWLLLWEVASWQDPREIFIASPVSVFVTLIGLIKDGGFWVTIAWSSFRITAGFVMALAAGIILAAAAYNSSVFRELISPVMKIMKTIPVASFIILALLWINNKTNLSILISFMMVLPLVYTNVLQGLRATERELLQMAKVFRISRWKKVVAIYVPAALPYFISAVSVGMGFCWKAGIAAEVIGIPSGSIGERLYEAKLYIMTKELFAWTLVIIAISMLFEKLVLRLLASLQKSPKN
ncbi:MAG TPA: ABC transporter permease subunit [Clostridiales bacterium]|nr:ABC transporter permease subunit [Clostridiales bacterium]